MVQGQAVAGSVTETSLTGPVFLTLDIERIRVRGQGIENHDHLYREFTGSGLAEYLGDSVYTQYRFRYTRIYKGPG